MAEKIERKTLYLRVPAELMDQLSARAEKNELSLNETAVRALTFALKASNPAMKVTTTTEVLTY